MNEGLSTFNLITQLRSADFTLENFDVFNILYNTFSYFNSKFDSNLLAYISLYHGSEIDQCIYYCYTTDHR